MICGLTNLFKVFTFWRIIWMKRIQSISALASFTAVLTAVGIMGCGQSGAPLATVKGVVTVNGSPAPAGLDISFQPTSDGRASFGSTDAEGRYELSLTVTKKGAQPGENIVTVQVIEEEDSPVPAGLADIKILKKFSDPATHKVVVENGSNTIDLEIATE